VVWESDERRVPSGQQTDRRPSGKVTFQKRFWTAQILVDRPVQDKPVQTLKEEP
jgi:hypothetical protein